MAKKSDRLEVRFDPETLSLWPADAKRRQKSNKMKAVVLHYVDNPAARTPTGGKFHSQRFTVRTEDGRTWYGTVKEGTDIVRLRPADEE